MNNIKVKILIILTIILIALTVIVCATTDVFKSSKEMFYKYLINGNISNITDKTYDDLLNKLQNKSGYEISGNINVAITSKEETLVPSKLKVNYNLLLDSNNDLYMKLKDSTNKDGAVIEMVKNDMTIGVKNKNNSDKYANIDLSKIEDFINKLGIDGFQVSNASEFDKYILFYISKEDRKTIIDTYKAVLDNNISNKKYSAEKGVNIEVNGNKYTCDAYKLKLDVEEVKNIQLMLLEELKNDQLTLNLIVEKYNMANIIGKDITKDDLLKNIQKMIERIKSKDYISRDLEIIVYANNAKTVRTEIISNNESIIFDTSKTKKGLTVVTKVANKEKNSELLYNLNNISDQEKECTLIYTEGDMQLKATITINISKADTSILKLNDNNSFNIVDEVDNFVDLLRVVISDDEILKEITGEEDIELSDDENVEEENTEEQEEEENTVENIEEDVEEDYDNNTADDNNEEE